MSVVLTDQGVKPDPKKQDCIQGMPTPTNKEEVRRLLDVVTYLSQFSKDLSIKSDPLRTLLKKDTAFIWEANEQKAFDEIKALISNAPLLKYFNPTATVEVQVDASCKVVDLSSMHQEPLLRLKNFIASSRKRCLVLDNIIASSDSIPTPMEGI